MSKLKRKNNHINEDELSLDIKVGSIDGKKAIIVNFREINESLQEFIELLEFLEIGKFDGEYFVIVDEDLFLLMAILGLFVEMYYDEPLRGSSRESNYYI